MADRGPQDVNVWRRLVARADVIAHSLTPKPERIMYVYINLIYFNYICILKQLARQASLILSSMARRRQAPEDFLRHAASGERLVGWFANRNGDCRAML